MKKSKLIEYQRKISEVLGYERLHSLHKIQKQSLNNQLNDLIEEHNYVVESITDDEIIGRYELVTLYVYPSDFIQISKMINEDKL